jgi:putative PIN family toxin of toxin-antitoxin system
MPKQLVVLDTNVLISGLLTPTGNAAEILRLAVTQKIQLGFDSRISSEYINVISRPKFGFDLEKNLRLLDLLLSKGLSIIAGQDDTPMPDETDRPFYEVALTLNALLITGNRKHFPQSPLIVTPAEFLSMYLSRG